MTKRIITVEDIQRANDRITGKVAKPVLCGDDAAFFERLKRTLPAIKDTPEIRKSWKMAQAN